MGIWHKIKNKLFKNRGSLVIEATFVYPIMFFTLLFLLYMGNAYYIKARVQSVVSAEAITYAEKFSDPNYENFSESIPTSVSDEEVTNHLYRYIDVFNLTDYGVATQSEKEELIERIEASNFFDGMTPSVTNVKTHRVHNYAIYHTYEVEVEYDIKFPLRMLFREEPTILHMDVREETPIADTPEFIRNVDMGVDYFESTETGENFKEHLTNAYERIDKFINGDKRDPSEAVAGGYDKKDLDDPENPFTKGANGEWVLKPNVTYENNGYTYQTDDQGRIVSVTGTLKKETAKRNPYAQRIVGRGDRIKKYDDGGHLIASQFGGSGDLDNLVPMAKNINRSGGKWYNMEQEWAKELEKDPPTKVDVNIRVVYEGTSQRPTRFEVEYSYDGEPQKGQEIPNY